MRKDKRFGKFVEYTNLHHIVKEGTERQQWTLSKLGEAGKKESSQE